MTVPLCNRCSITMLVMHGVHDLKSQAVPFAKSSCRLLVVGGCSSEVATLRDFVVYEHAAGELDLKDIIRQ